MGETITLGKVSVSPKGVYSSTTSYTFLDVVSNAGGAFLCLQNSTGIEPGVTSGWNEYWMEITQGIQNVSITSTETGKATISVTLSDGTVSSLTIDTAAIGDSAITQNMLAVGSTFTAVTAVLSVAGWSGNQQTVSVSGVPANTNIPVFTAPIPNDIPAYNDAGIICTAQGDGTLTFTCETAPTTAITINVVVLR